VKQEGLPELIRKLQSDFSPEIGIVFQDTKSPVSHSKKVGELTSLLQESFLEFVFEDLSLNQASSAKSGSLLNQEERVGLDRLVEALECTMWSSMIQKS
jgi:Alpha and gamma adaptin binding protein p34